MNRMTLALALALASAGCQQQPQPDGASLDTVHKAIVNGTATTQWPAVGALTLTFPWYGYQGSFCTGTLIAPRWVLTAGHCLAGEAEVATTSFMVGSDATPSPSGNGPQAGTLYAADGFYVHSQYNKNTLENDIALLHLEQPVTGVTPQEISAADLNAAGQDAHYVGFGATEGVGGAGGGIKRETDVEIGHVYASQFTSDYAGTGTCFGDSGGPALLQGGGTWRIIGITSAGLDCNPDVDPACAPDPCHRKSITTRVDVYADWISSTTSLPTPSCLDDAGRCACDQACQSDGACDNEVCQVQDCATTYGCLAACGDSASCYSACYGSATPAAQSQVSELLSCIRDSCADVTGEAYSGCVRDSCPDQVAACFPVGTGVWTCREVLDCVVNCPEGDEQCASECYQSGTRQAQDEFNDLADCLDTQCGDESDGFQACATAHCGEEIDTCLPTLTGPASCEEVVDCMGDCQAGDQGCGSDCLETGTETAQAQYRELADCSEAHCAAVSGDAFSSCLSGNCGAELDACLPPAHCPLTGGGCGAGTACYPTVTGATDCFSSNGKALGAACSDALSVLDCGDGAICVDDGDGGVCELWCTTDAVCGPGATCDKPLFSDLPDYGICGCEDVDQDGVCADEDCLDTDARVYPGAAEACGDGRDNDCDGQTDEGCASCLDSDQDGYCAEVDCDDAAAAANPGASERCGDGVDNDCDGATDEGCATCVDGDQDGYCADVDCFDDDPAAHPGAAEVCGDGKDNDCSGAADEGCAVDPNDPDSATTPPVDPGSSGGGCAGGGAAGAWLALMALLTLAMTRRRQWGRARRPSRAVSSRRSR